MVLAGAPVSQRNTNRYLITRMDGVTIYYPRSLQIKNGFSEIRIKARKSLFFTWLELEGAKAIPVVCE